jgi:HEAT repeat protein
LVPAFLKETPEISEEALRIIRKCEKVRGDIPRNVEYEFAGILACGNSEEKSRVAWALVYASGEESKEALIRALDAEEAVVVAALDALRIRDEEHFADHVVKVLTTELDWNELERIVDSINETWVGVPGETPTWNTRTAVLIAGMLFAEKSYLRLAATDALWKLRDERIAPLWIWVMRQDGSAFVRKKALHALISVLGDVAQPYLAEALRDPTPAVREYAMKLLIFLSESAIAQMMPEIRAIADDDPDETVRSYASGWLASREWIKDAEIQEIVKEMVEKLGTVRISR